VAKGSAHGSDIATDGKAVVAEPPCEGHAYGLASAQEGRMGWLFRGV
jgi:hypothetical protein